MSTVNTEKLSSARFAEATDAFVEEFTASVGFDKRMAQQDIQGSLAHAAMLCKIGILSTTELADIQRGLAQIAQCFFYGRGKTHLRPPIWVPNVFPPTISNRPLG